MRTDEEFINDVHKMAGRIRTRILRRRIALLSGVCAVLIVTLTGLNISLNKISNMEMTGTSMGTFMIDSAAGGYVLTAVIAFLTGTVVTVLIRNHVTKNGRDQEKHERDE